MTPKGFIKIEEIVNHPEKNFEVIMVKQMIILMFMPKKAKMIVLSLKFPYMILVARVNI